MASSQPMSSLEAAIKTPRLKIGKRGEIVEDWLNLIRSIICGYMICQPDSRQLVKQFIAKLEIEDIKFTTKAKKKMVSKTKRRAQYLGLRSEDLDPKSQDPLWLQRFLYAKYPALGVLTDEIRDKFRQEILGLTDVDIVENNLESHGGGRGRTPTGSFTEAANSYFTVVLGESQRIEDQIVLKIWDVFSMIKGAVVTLQVYQIKKGLKPNRDSSYFLPPVALYEKLEGLGKRVKSESSDEVDLTPSSEDLADMAEHIERFIKDVGISLIRLTETLNINKKNLIASIWRHFAIFGDYDRRIRQIFKNIKGFLAEDLVEVKSHFNQIKEFLIEVDLGTEELEPSGINMAAQVLEQGFEDPLKLFKLDRFKDDLSGFRSTLRHDLGEISDCRQSLSKLKNLSNLFDKNMSRLERLANFLRTRNGDRTKLEDFYVLFEQWNDFYDLVAPIEKILMLGYSFEFNLHQAWIFIEKLNKRTTK